MSRYAQVLAEAEAERRTYWARDAARTRAFFDAHPENRRLIAGIVDERVVRHPTREIDIEQRLGQGWFDRVVHEAQPARVWWVMPRDGVPPPERDTAWEMVDVNGFASNWLEELQRAVQHERQHLMKRRVKQTITGTGGHDVTVAKGAKRESTWATTEIAGTGGTAAAYRQP